MLILGVTGHPSSGKDTVASYLQQKGFAHISTGDILREEMTRLGLPLDREQMNRFSTEQRRKRGNSYPADIASERIVGDSVISGLRNTAEVSYLKGFLGPSFKLLIIDAPLKARYERARQRNRVGDDISFEMFKKQEELERKDDTASHEMDNVIALSDYIITNDSSLGDVYAKIDDLLAAIRKVG